MKKSLFLFFISALLVFSGCSKLSSLEGRMSDVEARVEKLERACKDLDANVQSMLVAIQALQQGDYITSVTPIKKGDEVIGYTLTLAKLGEIKVLNGTNGIDGLDGLDGEDGRTPLFKIEQGYWYISYDEGKTWEKAGRATGEDASPILKTVTVTEEEVTFVLQDGTSFSLPRHTEDHLNLPSSIILVTESIKNVNKGDTVQMEFIVNPSDFAVSKEKLSFLANHHLYTKYDVTIDPQTKQQIETPFDENAHCDLSVVDITRSEKYEGSYSIAVKIDGEGNFFDDITAFLLYGDKDYKEKTRYICSGTNTDITVIPSIKDAFRLEIPNQSFYSTNIKTLTPDSLKTQYMGMWMNNYKDKASDNRVYDRSLITSIQLEGDECSSSCALNANDFKTTGIIEMKLDESSEYWSQAIKSYEEQAAQFTCYPQDSKITFSRLSGESVTYSIAPARIFFKSVFEFEQMVDLAQLEQTKSVRFNISDMMSYSGIDDSFKSLSNITIARVDVPETGAGCVLEYNSANNDLNVMFYSLTKIKQNKKVSLMLSQTYRYAAIQKDNGLFDPFSSITKKDLLECITIPTVKLNEQ